MDAPTRRPTRAPPTHPPPRRPLFHTTTTTSSTSHPPSNAPSGPRAPIRTTTSKPPHVHIPPDRTVSPSADLVERDAQGNYKMTGPSAALRRAMEKPTDPEEEEKEQEEAVIAMYKRGMGGGAWEQGGEFRI